MYFDEFTALQQRKRLLPEAGTTLKKTIKQPNKKKNPPTIRYSLLGDCLF
jgi:hypothetical protein